MVQTHEQNLRLKLYIILTTDYILRKIYYKYFFEIILYLYWRIK